MDKALVLIGLLAITIGFNWRAGRLARRAVAGRKNAEELQAALATPVRFLSFLITPSLLAAFLITSEDAEVAIGSGDPTGVAWTAAGRVLLGSALLLELVARSAGNQDALDEPTSELVGLRAMRGLFTSVAARFFWAALGVAALFGGTADRQVASVLAFDSALLAGAFALAHRSRRRRWKRAADGFCDALDPMPSGAPNMTELTRCFPSDPIHTVRVHDGTRIELGERRQPRVSPFPIVQGLVACLAVLIASGLAVNGRPAAALGSIVAASVLVALAEREKRRPPYRVSIDTAAGIIRVTLARLGASTETIPLRDARLEVQRSDEEGYSPQGRLLLILPGTEIHPDSTDASRRLPLLDWVPYGEAREAALALARHTRLPLNM